MLRRHGRSGFAANMWVFPGGTVDPGDELPAGLWRGLDAGAAAARMGVEQGLAVALHVAAARETFEEAGVLLAVTSGGEPVPHDLPGMLAARQALNERGGRFSFGAWLAGQGLVLDLGALVPWRRMITPVLEPRRYDTFFFLARMPHEGVAAHDAVETTSHRWLTPRAALDDAGVGVIYPTERGLEWLAEHDRVDAALRAAASERIEPVLPHVLTDAQGRRTRIVAPDEPDYPHEVYGSAADAGEA